MTLPAIGNLGVHAEGGVPVVNSRDVAERFEKRHDHVLRDIEILVNSTAPDLGWFRRTEYRDAKGEMRVSFNLTRQGFVLLGMGWTGERIMAFKVSYIQAFDAMEEELKRLVPVTANNLVLAIRELVAPLTLRFDYQDGQIHRVESKVDVIGVRVEGLAVDVLSIKDKLAKHKRQISQKTRCQHIDAIRFMGGRCPSCMQVVIIAEDGTKVSEYEFDHFYTGTIPDVAHTWVICKNPCHADLTAGRILRIDREPQFRAYQTFRIRLFGGKQLTLF